MSYEGVTRSAMYYFEENGYLEKVVAYRYKDHDDRHNQSIACTGEVKENKQMNGLTIPTHMDVLWD